MLQLTSPILLPLVVLVFSVSELSEANSYRVKGLQSPEAKEVMLKLQKEEDDLKDSCDDYTNNLGSNNDVLHAMKAYRKAYALATGTDCAEDEPPPNEDIDNHVIRSFTDYCEKYLAIELDDFSNKILLLKGKVKDIDNNLHATCTSDPSSCDKAKKEATEKLNCVLTPELVAELKSDASAVLEIFKTRMDKCFKRDTAEFRGDIVKGTESMNTCLATKS